MPPTATWCRILASQYLNPVRREAQLKAAETKQVQEALRLDRLRDRMIDSWTQGSSRRDSVLLKRAAKEEFGLDVPVWKQGRHKFKPEEIADARQAIRRLYETTQQDLKHRGVSSIYLLRGVSAPAGRHGSVEAWTTSIDVARKFADYGIIDVEVPASRILAFSGGPGWRNGPHGEEWEYLVLGGVPT